MKKHCYKKAQWTTRKDRKTIQWNQKKHEEKKNTTDKNCKKEPKKILELKWMKRKNVIEKFIAMTVF